MRYQQILTVLVLRTKICLATRCYQNYFTLGMTDFVQHRVNEMIRRICRGSNAIPIPIYCECIYCECFCPELVTRVLAICACDVLQIDLCWYVSHYKADLVLIDDI